MPEILYEFVEFQAFIRQLSNTIDPHLLLEKIQEELLKNPEAGSLIKGGIRKARISAPGRTVGKRGGYRVWYYFFRKGEAFLLLFLLDKKYADNISPQQEETLVLALKDVLKRS
jgi:hypothetical protein